MKTKLNLCDTQMIFEDYWF